jgi:hypothetical protein
VDRSLNIQKRVWLSSDIRSMMFFICLSDRAFVFGPSACLVISILAFIEVAPGARCNDVIRSHPRPCLKHYLSFGASKRDWSGLSLAF